MKRTIQIGLSVSMLAAVQIIAAQGNVSSASQSNALRRDQMQEASRQRQRFQELLREKKYEQAESVLDLIESYKGTNRQTKERAQIALWREDFGTSRKELATFFEGDAKTWRSVSGAQDLRAWYWFLLSLNGNEKKADEVMSDLFADQLANPFGRGSYDPKLASSKKLAQVYMYLADYSLHIGNYFRSDRYITLAKSVDRNVKVDPGFAKILSLHGPATWRKKEAEERLPMLDHLAMQKKLGKPIQVF